ncbi:MAG: helix-turn-helix domain-containing protein, partial [Hyphomonadaceae bacterium]
MTVTPLEEPETLDPAALAEIARVRESGVLGASGRLLELFEFLAMRSTSGRPPKEAEIALAVFGKVGPDSMRDDPVARVYIHRLRKRLDDFYLRHGMPNGVRLDIPKGDYRIACSGADGVEAGVETEAEAIAQVETVRRPKISWRMAAACLAVLAIGGNIVAWTMFANRPAVSTQLADSGIWTEIANSKRPLLIVVGDYYMFGEYEDRTKLKRLIRDFAINSKEDLASSQWSNPKDFDRYSDVALHYLPASAAFALADLAPLIQEGRKVQVTLSSNLPLERMKTDDIIYVGLLSGLGPLRDPVFSTSRFALGKSYDQIIDTKAGRAYNSEAFLAAPSDQMYRDYGFFSTFAGPTGNRIVILSGSRDTAVMGVAEAVTQMDRLARVEKKTPNDGDFEALFEVKGQKHMNLEASVLAAYP